MKDIINQYKEYKKEKDESVIKYNMRGFVGRLNHDDLFEVFEYLEQLHDQIEEIEKLRLKNKG